MKFWPRLRESLFTLWHKLLDYDRKIPAAKRERTRLEREVAKGQRIKKDKECTAKAAIASASAYERKRQSKAIADLETDSTILPPPQKSNATPKAASNSIRNEISETLSWPYKGQFDCDIVGESNHQSVIARFAGEVGEYGAEEECIASLVLEDTNKFDSKAVAVKIEGCTVGYLAREDAPRFRKRLSRKGLAGMETTCMALITGGGTKRNGEKLFFGVKLDIKPFD